MIYNIHMYIYINIHEYIHAWMLASEATRFPCVRRTRFGREVVPLVCMYMTGLVGEGGGSTGEGAACVVCVCGFGVGVSVKGGVFLEPYIHMCARIY